MATQLQLRKGTKIQNDAFTGAEAEMTYVSTTKGLRIHDGSTQGGIDVPTAATADYVVESQVPTAENNYTWYRKYKSGWVEQGGHISGNSATTSVTFPVTMADTNYCLNISIISESESNAPTYYSVGAKSKSTTGFTAYNRTSITKDWMVAGIAA